MEPQWEGKWVDLYRVLGLNAGCEAWAAVATAQQLHRAYESTKTILLNASATDDRYEKYRADLKLVRLEWAYDVLGDPDFRRNYDGRFLSMVDHLKKIASWKVIAATLGHVKRKKKTASDDEHKKAMAREREEADAMAPEREEAEATLRMDQEAEELGRLVAAKMKIDCGEEEAANQATSWTRKRPREIPSLF